MDTKPLATVKTDVDHWCITLYQHTNLVELLLVRYGIACLRLFVDHKIYRDLITTLIIGVLSFNISHQFPYLAELLLVRYSNACLRLFGTRFTWFIEILC